MRPTLNRRHFTKLMTAGAAGAAALTAAPPLGAWGRGRQERPPNIVFIMADDLGYNHLGCYGQDKIRTPHIDRLAAQGIRYTQAYAGSTVCAPSRASLMTGYHQGHASVRGNSGGIPLLPEDVTVAEVLQEAGYATGCFGKWGLGDAPTTGIPTKQGFDEYFGTLDQVHAHFYYPEYLWHNEEKYPLPGNQDGGREQYSNDLFTEFALKFIREHKDEPFFCYVPFTIPHTELLVPEDSLAEYRGTFPETPFVYEGHYAGQETPHAAFAAMVTRMDGYVGQIMALLRELGLEENTLVLFTSDNGGQQDSDGVDLEFFHGNWPLRGWKGVLYEGGIRVPAIARWPGKIAPGTVSNQVWAFWDVLPTLAEIGGAKAPAGIDGISIAPELLGTGLVEHPTLYWEVVRRGELYQAIRMGGWKAVRHGKDQPTELYYLPTDIAEKFNLAGTHPERVQEAERLFVTSRTEPRPQIDNDPPDGRYW